MVSFSTAGGLELSYTAARTWWFRDVTNAKNWVLAAARRGEWERGHALVTEVVDASRELACRVRHVNTSLSGINEWCAREARIQSGVGWRGYLLNWSQPKSHDVP
jgi:hypothetical protein